MNDIDILLIDSKIKKKLEDDIINLPETKNKLFDIVSSINSMEKSTNIKKQHIIDELNQAKTDLELHIINLENRTDYNFYISESLPILEKYKNIIKKPIKISFLGKRQDTDKDKQQIIKNFIEIAEKYVIIDFQQSPKQTQNTSISNTSPNIICNNCNISNDFNIVDINEYVCNNCFAQQTIIKYTSSYIDIGRINISTKYMYDRRIHFRDSMNQYQGKQNSTIKPEIYDKLEQEFEKQHLLINSPDKFIKFKNITKNHILIFLKELGYANHYENVHLIHYNLTGQKPDDISYLEEKLLDDFDKLTELYDKIYKNINRKNFINTQHVLYQLLKRHKHPCKCEDFVVLKTIDRKFFHDEICKNLFEKLEWTYQPFY